MIDDPLLRLSAVSVGYDGSAVVRAVDLTVERGDVLALVGPNGSGKSTLVKAVLGLAEVLDGELQLFGTPVATFRERGRVGYVPQRSAIAGIVPSTVHEVVAAGRLARTRPLRRFRSVDRDAIDTALERVGLSPLAHTRVSTLSGGQQRRVLIARALAGEPELLVLDEPLAGVDFASQGQLAETLRKLSESGTTIVVVLHELGPLRPLVTRIARLREGTLVYDGPVTAQLLADLHEDELGHHDHHHDVADPGRPPDGGSDLGLTG
jgi:zinc transport system ATP-binding protein